MKTSLIEFESNGSTLRGLFVSSGVAGEKVVVMLPGFERTAISEKKFKLLSDELSAKGVSSFRFDFAGFGISDGDFSKTTITSMVRDYVNAMKTVKQLGNDPSMVVAHSLSGCVVSSVLQANKKLDKIVLLAPALNQKDLLRYWYVINAMKIADPKLTITWDNYQEYFDEAEFVKDCQKESRLTKANTILRMYYMENMDTDYTAGYANSLNRVLHVHGDRDASVPLSSLNASFGRQILVKGGDHDMERVDMTKQWVDKCVEFLT